MLQAQHLDQALIQFDEGGCDAMLSAVRIKAFFWNDDGTPMNYDPLHRPMRQAFGGTLMENGAFYISKRGILSRFRCRLGGRIDIYEMPGETAVEVDEPHDWEIISRLLEQRGKWFDDHTT